MGNHQKFIHIQQRGSEPFPWLHIQQLLKPASLTQPRVGSRRCGRRQAKAARVLQPNRSSMGRRTDTGVCCAKAGAGLRLRLGRAAAEGGCQWVIAPAGGAAPKCQAPGAFPLSQDLFYFLHTLGCGRAIGCFLFSYAASFFPLQLFADTWSGPCNFGRNELSVKAGLPAA